MKKKLRTLIHVSKTTFILGISCFVIPTIQAQNCATILDDFDSNRNLGAYTTPTGGVLTQAAANPSISGLNTSTLVAKYVSSTDLNDNLVVQTDKIINGDLLRFNQVKLTMMVYSLKQGTIEVTLRKKGSNSLTYPAGRHTVLRGSITSSNTWNLVTFLGNNSFSPDPSLNADSIGELEVKFPAASGGIGETFYFDNIQLSPYSSIDNFDNSRNISVLSFIGTLSQVYPNSSDLYNSSTKCAAYKKPAGNGNATITYATGSVIQPDMLKSGIDKLGIQFYSNAALMTVKVSLVNTKVVPNAVHSTYEAKTSQYSKWEFLTLDYVSSPSPTTLASDVDAIILEFDPGAANTLVYRFDELFVKKATVAAPVISGDIRPCVGSATYAYSIPSVTNASYEWVVPTGSSISSGANTNAVEVLYPTVFTMKNIHARYTKLGGCPSEWSSKLISVSSVNPPLIYAGGDATVCEGVGFKLSGAVGGSSSGTWSSTGTGTFTPNKNVPDAVYTPSTQDANGFGLVTLTFKTVGGNCGQGTDAMEATILAKPSFLSITPNTTVCTTATSITLKATSNVGSKLNWFGQSSGFTPTGGVVNNGTDIVYTFASYEKTIGNTSNLIVTSDYNYACGTITSTVKVTFNCVITEVDEPIALEEVVQLFPNPSVDGHFTLNLKEDPKEIILTDMLGKQEYFYTKEFSTNLSGILSAKVSTSNKSYSFKLTSLK